MNKKLVMGILVLCLAGNCYTLSWAQAKKASRKSASRGSAVAKVDSNKESWYTRESSRLYADKKYEEAWELLKQAEMEFPNSLFIAGWKGLILVELGRYDEAMPYLKRVLNGGLKPQRAAAYGAMGKMYLKKKEYDQAIKYYKLMLPLGGDSYDYYLLANAYDEAGMFDDAIKNYTAAMSGSDKNYYLMRKFGDFGEAMLYELRGNIYLQQGELTAAKADWRKIIELCPRYKGVFGDEQNIKLYFDFKKRKQVADEALAAARKAKDAGDFSEAFGELERAYDWMPVWDRENSKLCSEEVVEEFMNVYPKLSVKPALSEDARRIFVQADAYTRNKDYQGALKSYRKLLAFVPWYPEGWYNLSLIEGDSKFYSNAIKDMKRYLRLVPDAADSRAAQDKIYEWEAFVLK